MISLTVKYPGYPFPDNYLFRWIYVKTHTRFRATRETISRTTYTGRFNQLKEWIKKMKYHIEICLNKSNLDLSEAGKDSQDEIETLIWRHPSSWWLVSKLNIVRPLHCKYFRFLMVEISCPVEIKFSNVLVTHQIKTKEMITVKVVWISDFS